MLSNQSGNEDQNKILDLLKHKQNNQHNMFYLSQNQNQTNVHITCCRIRVGMDVEVIYRCENGVYAWL